MLLRIIICLAVFNLSALAQEKPSDFVLDHTKPWAYLRLDYVGARKAVFKGEGDVGIWLRLVNNCRLPIKTETFGHGPDGLGALLFDDVVPIQEGLSIRAYAIPTEPSYQRESPTPPRGYRSTAVGRLDVAIIKPGEDLLFSVPRNHVGEQWNMTIEFFLDVDGSPGLTGPSCYLYISEGDVTKDPPAKTPVAPQRQ